MQETNQEALQVGQKTKLICQKIKWHGRDAFQMGNDSVRLVTLTGGGHIAEFRFTGSTGRSTVNPLWVPAWKTMEPSRFRAKRHAARYGNGGWGQLLAGIVGPNICLDYFGAASEEEAKQGLGGHGEAPVVRWRKIQLRKSDRKMSLTLSTHLPVADLDLHRELTLRQGESVVYVEETVVNKKKCDHFLHWQQHVTLGPPFLSHQDCHVAMSGTRGKTFPHPYGSGKELLATGREFRWPIAPTLQGGTIDLSRTLSRKGSGVLATVLLDRRREVQYVGALNTRHRVLLAYCFRFEDYPWSAIWEENHSRPDAPWSGKSETRGLEFGSTAFPVGRQETFALGKIFGTPSVVRIPGRGRKTIRYIFLLAPVPGGFGLVSDIRLEKNAVLVRGTRQRDPVRLGARGLAEVGLV